MNATMDKIESLKRDRQRATECGYGVIKTSWKLIKALTKNCKGEGKGKERERQRGLQPKDLLPTWLNNYRRLSKAPLQMRAST